MSNLNGIAESFRHSYLEMSQGDGLTYNPDSERVDHILTGLDNGRFGVEAVDACLDAYIGTELAVTAMANGVIVEYPQQSLGEIQ